MANALVQKREELGAKQLAAKQWWDQHDDLAFTAEEVEEAKRMDAELTDLQKGVEDLIELDQKRSRVEQVGQFVGQPGAAGGKGAQMPYPLPGAGGQEGGYGQGFAATQKSLGELWVESKGVKEYNSGAKRGPEVQLPLATLYQGKATLTTTGYAPQAVRTGLTLPLVTQKPTVADLIPGGRTDMIAVVYMEETSNTNAAAVTAEAAAKPESALAFTERSAPVRKIATFLPVTDELTQDAPAMMSYVDGRLRLFMLIAEDLELLNGDGTGVHVTGLLHATNLQTGAQGTDNIIGAVLTAMAQIQTTTYLPATGIVIHPLDWLIVRKYQETTGAYIMAHPADANYSDRLWGLPVVQTTAITQGTVLVGAFDTCAQIFRKQDLVMSMTDSHSDWFQKNILAIRAEERLALVPYRGAGFYTVTGTHA